MADGRVGGGTGGGGGVYDCCGVAGGECEWCADVAVVGDGCGGCHQGCGGDGGCECEWGCVGDAYDVESYCSRGVVDGDGVAGAGVAGGVLWKCC